MGERDKPIPYATLDGDEVDADYLADVIGSPASYVSAALCLALATELRERRAAAEASAATVRFYPPHGGVVQSSIQAALEKHGCARPHPLAEIVLGIVQEALEAHGRPQPPARLARASDADLEDLAGFDRRMRGGGDAARKSVDADNAECGGSNDG